jgi:hypothetical protein
LLKKGWDIFGQPKLQAINDQHHHHHYWSPLTEIYQIPTFGFSNSRWKIPTPPTVAAR